MIISLHKQNTLQVRGRENKPLLKKKRAAGAGNKWPPSHQHRARYGTSTTEPVCFLSCFIQSALNEGGEAKKEVCLTDTLHEEEKDGGPRLITDSHEINSIAEMVKGRRGYGESRLRARKTIKLGKMS